MRINQWNRGKNIPAHLKKWECAELEIEISKIEWHEKSRRQQAVAFFEEADETVLVNGQPLRSLSVNLKIVLDTSHFNRTVEVGQIWRVRAKKIIPTKLGAILIAKPEEFLGESESFQRQRAKEMAEAAEAVEAFLADALGKETELSISLPDSPRHAWEAVEVWDRVDHYIGRLVSWTTYEDGTIEVKLDGVSHRRSSSDIEGSFEGRERFLDGKRPFSLHGARVNDWGDHKDLTGINPGTLSEGEKHWKLFVWW